MPDGRPPRVLLVEDNKADARLVLESLTETKAPVSVSIVEDGEAAMDFLQKEGNYGGVGTPDLVLLDLNLPKKDGREVLAEMMADEELRQIPVVVLTTSCAEEDIIRCYSLGANCYVTKPVGLDKFIDAVASIEHFWLHVVTLPGT